MQCFCASGIAAGDASGLQFQTLNGQNGVLLYKPKDRAPTQQQIETARRCYQHADRNFEQMLQGHRELSDYSP